MPSGRPSPLRYVLLLVLLGAMAACTGPESRSVDAFFRDFTDEWVRRNPNLAVRTQYFEGEEQDRLSRQLTPITEARQRERIRLAQQGLDELAMFDRDTLTASQRVSADVMQWQLQSIV